MKQEFRAGDRVWHMRSSEWMVLRASITTEYPLVGKREETDDFEEDNVFFTKNGHEYEYDKIQSIFFDKIEFDIPPRPLLTLEVDTKVIVGEAGKKYNRYFKKFNQNGKIVCFPSGRTSFSKVDETEEEWDNYEVVKRKLYPRLKKRAEDQAEPPG